MSAVAQQPISVGIEAASAPFQHYKSGVFSGDCGSMPVGGAPVGGARLRALAVSRQPDLLCAFWWEGRKRKRANRSAPPTAMNRGSGRRCAHNRRLDISAPTGRSGSSTTAFSSSGTGPTPLLGETTGRSVCLVVCL